MSLHYTPWKVIIKQWLKRERIYVYIWLTHSVVQKKPGLSRWLSGKPSARNAEDVGDLGSIPGWGRSLGGENGNPFQ